MNTYLSLGGISWMAKKTGQTDTDELLKMGIPSVFSVERQFEPGKIPLDSHGFLYSLPSVTSFTWPENGLYLSCRVAWMVSHIAFPLKEEGPCHALS